MSKEKYYDISDIKKLDADYNIILGERSNGKSFAVKENAINDSLDGIGDFVYLRRWDLDIKKSKVDAYFKDIELVKRLKKKTKDKIDCVQYRAGDLYFCKHINRTEIERIQECGCAMSLSGDTHFKSMNIPNIANMIFEEFVTDDMYLDDEVDVLFSVVSTVARRNKIKVWLIGNTISRLCPYFNEWGLSGIAKQKKGTIEVYEHEVRKIVNGKEEVNVIRIAVELCADVVSNKMFFGQSAKMVTAGEWQTRAYPKLPYNYNEYNILYTAVLVKMNMMYRMEVLRRSDNPPVLYVHPINNIRKYNRLIIDGYDENPLITDCLTPKTKGDMIIIDLIKQNKICYSDNLTGTEFQTLLKGGDII